MAEHREPIGGSTNSRAAFDYRSSRTLLRRVLIQGKPAWSSWLLEDRHEEAQTVVDFLSKVLDDRVDLEGHEEKQILSAIRLIAKSTQVYPRGCELQGVQCDLSQPLNEGGFGYIYRGRLGNRAVCVKAVRLFTQQDNTRNLRVQAKEFALCVHLSHPNILPCYGIYIPEPGKPKICIVSQWMQRGDLRAYLSAYPDGPRRLLLVDVIAGLDYLHKHGIIHADLKAANVLVSDFGHAVIGDFGIAHITSGYSSTRQTSGTWNWTAPELLADETEKPSERSDIWSFGCLSYEVLTDEMPFSHCKTTFQLIALVVTKSMSPLSASSLPVDWIEPRLRSILEQCLKHDPFDRPASSTLHEWFKQLNIPDNRLPVNQEDHVLREVQTSRSELTINYEQVCDILQRLLYVPASAPNGYMIHPMPSLVSPEHRPANQSPHIGSNTGPGRLPFIPPPPPPPLPTSPPMPSVYPISPPLQSPQGHSAHPSTPQTFSSFSSPPSHTNTPTARPSVPPYSPARPSASVPPNATPPRPPVLSPLNQSFSGTPYASRHSALARSETVEVAPLYFHPVSHSQQHPNQNNYPASRPSGPPPAGPPSRSSTVLNPPPLPFHILAPFSEPSYVQEKSSDMLWSQNNATGIGDEEAPPAFRLARLSLNDSTEAESQHYESPPVWVPDLPSTPAASGYPASNTSHPQGPGEDIWGQRVQASAPIRRETYKTLWSDESDASPTTAGYTRQSPHQYIQDLAEPGHSSSNHTMRPRPGADAQAAVHSHGFRQPTPYNRNQIPQGLQYFVRGANPARHTTYPDPSSNQYYYD